MPTPGTSEHSRKHQIYNDNDSSNKLVWLDFKANQRHKICQLF